MIGSSKQSKPYSVLEMEEGCGRPPRDAIITWLDGEIQKITVPLTIPAYIKQNPGKKPKTMRQIQHKEQQEELSVVHRRMLDMVKTLHPSAYKQSSLEEDPWNPLRGVKFSYSDRAEPCYTGDVHSGQNLRCWISESHEVWVQCFSPSCQHAEKLGCLDEDTERYGEHAVHVNLRYLGRNKFLADDNTLEGQLRRLEEPTGDYILNQLIDRWLHGDFKVLNIQSPLGTGKSTMINQLIEERFQDKNILVVTYRQSLALELTGSKLNNFTNYMDVPASHDKTEDTLWDRKRFPRVVCQYNSIWRLGETAGWIPTFDLVILDEIMSLLNFTSARIIRRAKMRLSAFNNMLTCHPTHILTMDAFFGEQAYQLFSQLNLKQEVVINDWRTLAPREYRFSKSEGRWQLRIAQDLAAGNNVAVVSMSSEAIHRLTTYLIEDQILSSEDVLVHVASGDDNLKRQLVDCESLWKQYRLVCYSPTVESGCDFSIKHFHRLYVYCCLQSTTPLGLVQVRPKFSTEYPSHMYSKNEKCK